MTPTNLPDLCQQCQAEPRKPKERYCAKCGQDVRREARRKAWEMTPDPIIKHNELRGRKTRAIDNSPKTYLDDE
jgi:predicted amidophosphoribosyltransferase